MNDDNVDIELRNSIRKMLIELRKSKGITQTELGKAVGKSKTAVASWEQGLSLPDPVTLYRLSKYYNVLIDKFYEKEGE